jgi:phosphoribosylaminoimidazole-succinocarboxamide synthase
MTTELPLKVFSRGKVRDTYDLGEFLLLISTDRISAFDFVLPCGIPKKGQVLNQLSAFWFGLTKNIIRNHLIESVDNVKSLDKYVPTSNRFAYPAYLKERSMVVKKAKRLPIECVVRGYLAGSAWAEYKESGTVNSIPLKRGFQESEELPTSLFTPTNKAETGHDEPISLEEMKKLVGDEVAEEIRDISLQIYGFARKYARERGIIIADTKFEFGLDGGKLILIDELLTPDSSRIWEVKLYKVGQSQPSHDKQPVRDWLTASGWNKQPPTPMLSPEVVEATSKRYIQAYERITGKKLA